MKVFWFVLRLFLNLLFINLITQTLLPLSAIGQLATTTFKPASSLVLYLTTIDDRQPREFDDNGIRFTEFSACRTSSCNTEYSGRPVAVATLKIIETKHGLAWTDQTVKMREIIEAIELPHGWI